MAKMQGTDGMNYSKRCRWQEIDIIVNRFGQGLNDRVLNGFFEGRVLNGICEKPKTLTSRQTSGQRNAPSFPGSLGLQA